MRFLARLPSVVLAVLAATFLLGALGIAYRAVVCGISEPSITVAALLATLAGLFLTARQQIADRAEATSRFYLEQYQSGFDTAYEILESAVPGDPFLRMKWIAAARVLATARQLLERVSVSANRDVARMNIPNQSQRFQQFFDRPSWYYYATTQVISPGEQWLDEAAKLSTKGSGSTVSTLLYVPERAVHTVYQSVAYPKSYKEVLGEI